MSETKRGRKPKSVAELLQDAPTPKMTEIQKQRANKQSNLKPGEFIAVEVETGKEFVTNDLMFKHLTMGKRGKYKRKANKPTELEN